MEQGLGGAWAGGPPVVRIGQWPCSSGSNPDNRQTSFLPLGTMKRPISHRCSGSWLARKGCQFHGTKNPVCCYTFYLCDLNSLRQNTLGYMLGTINRNSLKSLQVTQFSSVTQSCLTLWHPVNCNMPGLPVHHQLPEFTQTHVHWVGDAI